MQLTESFGTHPPSTTPQGLYDTEAACAAAIGARYGPLVQALERERQAGAKGLTLRVRQEPGKWGWEVTRFHTPPLRRLVVCESDEARR